MKSALIAATLRLGLALHTERRCKQGFAFAQSLLDSMMQALL
jgi:hypothetical protein